MPMNGKDYGASPPRSAPPGKSSPSTPEARRARDRFRKMSISERFGLHCQRDGFVLLPHKTIPQGKILLAEKYTASDPDHDQPHFQIVWAIERKDADVFQVLYCSPFSSQAARINAAMIAARDWAAVNVEAGRY